MLWILSKSKSDNRDRNGETECSRAVAESEDTSGAAAKAEPQREIASATVGTDAGTGVQDAVQKQTDMTPLDNLPALAAKIRATLAVKPEIFVTHPAELRILREMSDAELRQFAAENGWCIVRRIGGRQIEFYNDASEAATIAVQENR